jgi:glucosamine--fructose-6-phosphate aminotransferase (isomerizing)
MSSDDRSWHTASHPELRDAPPWVMQEMIEAQPGLAGPIAEAPGAETMATAIRQAAEAGEPLVVVGCGTSEHGALAVAALLDEALRSAGFKARVECRQALDAALDPRSGGFCLGISHDGTTRATILALAAARETGAVTATIGARDDSPTALGADHVLVTPLRDRSWCHTVAYSSAILAGAAIARQISGGGAVDGGAILAGALAQRERIEQLAAHVDGAQRILSVGLGADFTTARELALKIEEGARIPATALQLESLLHGHLAGCDADTTALVLFAADARSGARGAYRLQCAAGAAAAIGIPTVAIGAEAALAGLPAGVERLILPPEEGAELLSALLTGAVALQLLTLSLAHLVGSNPDLIRREQAAYREAARVAETRADW